MGKLCKCNCVYFHLRSTSVASFMRDPTVSIHQMDLQMVDLWGGCWPFVLLSALLQIGRGASIFDDPPPQCPWKLLLPSGGLLDCSKQLACHPFIHPSTVGVSLLPVTDHCPVSPAQSGVVRSVKESLNSQFVESCKGVVQRLTLQEHKMVWNRTTHFW